MSQQLTPIEDGIWVCNGGIVSFWGFAYPTRSVVVRLADGLWVWSPVDLSAELRDEVEALGPVAHLVSPNKIHHLFLAAWKEAFPAARLWGLRSCIARHPELAFEAPLGDSPPSEWRGVIDQAWFTGSAFLDEVMFLHAPSRTAIVADLIQAFSEEFLRQHWAWWQRPLARLDGLSAERPGAPREWRASFVHLDAARAARVKVLSWSCERVIIAHGDGCRTGGEAYLRRALAWMGPESEGARV